MGVGLMNWVTEMSFTDAPFLWKNRAQSYRAIAGAFGDDLRKRALDKGFMLTGWTDLGFRCMTNNRLPINSVKDMQNLKMRVPNSKAYIAMMQATGATTVAVDLSELYLALRQGVADGQDTPVSVVKSNKYYEVQKHISKTDHILTTAYTVTNPKFYDGLTGDARMMNAQAMKPKNAVKEAAALRRRILGLHMTFAAPAAIEVLVAADIEFVYLDGEHGCFDWRDIEAGCVTAERHGLTTIAR